LNFCCAASTAGDEFLETDIRLSDSPGSGSPTKVRWQILGILSLIMVATAFGRLNLGIAGKSIQEEFHLSSQAMGWIFGAFAFGYALFQIPSGWAADHFGPRKTLTLAILCWATLTMAMNLVPFLAVRLSLSLAWTFGLLRFLTGLGEAASYPNANRVVAFWTTKTERGIGSSLLLGGVGAGGVLAPALFAMTTQHWGWRASFFVSGIFAIVVASFWFLFSTNRPEEHPRVNSGELKILGADQRALNQTPKTKVKTPWRKILSSRSVWALLLSYFFHGYTPFIYFTWFFIYLTHVRGLTVAKGGLWGTTPFIAMTLMSPMGGWLSDKAVKAFGTRRGRQSTAFIGMTCSALLLWLGSRTENNAAAILMLAGAAGFSNFAAPSWWASCIDLAPNHSGSLSALMNTCANSAGGIAPVLTAYLATTLGWTRALDFAAMMSFTAGLIWFFVDASEGVESVETNFKSAPQAALSS
jgi:ACS family glucarate transporter-like MFS transporter